jgi:hypothetical protein
MATHTSAASFAKAIASTGLAIGKSTDAALRAVGKMGVDEMNVEATKLWGGDRKFSGAARSAKAKRAANAAFKASEDRVEIYPLGDPWYITARGRAAKVIKPRRRSGKKALRLPDGEVRSTVMGGALPARPEVVKPPFTRIGQKAPRIMRRTITDAVRKGT